MAVLKEYNSPNAGGGLRQNNAGISALESEASTVIRTASLAERETWIAGRAIGGAIKATGDVAERAFEQYVVQPEISKGAAALAGYQDNLTTKWNELAKTANVNDASIRQKFIEDELEPSLQKFNEGFQTAEGKKFAESQSNSFRKHMFEKTTADMATRAGEAIVQNVSTLRNTLSNTVRNDPSSYDHSTAMVDASVRELVANTPGLSAAAAAKIEGSVATGIKSELAKATILGVAERNPDKAQEMINSGKFDKLIDGTEMSNMVKTMKNASRADQNFARIEKERQEAAVSEATADSYVTRMYGGVGTKLPSVKEIALDPNLSLKDRRMLIDTAMKRSEQTPDTAPVLDNPDRVNDLMSRLTDPVRSLKLADLVQAVQDKEMSDATFNRLNGLRKEIDAEPFKDPAIKATFDAVEATLTNKIPGMNNADPKGQEAVSRWKLQVMPQLLALQKAGKLTPADLDMSDPNSFISKSYKPFERTMAQKISDYTAEMSATGAKPVVSAAPTATVKEYDGSNPPPSLRGIASLTYSPSKKMFRDDTTNKLYDKNGNEVK